MARKNGRQHSPDEAGRLEKIWNLSLPLKRKTTILQSACIPLIQIRISGMLSFSRMVSDMMFLQIKQGGEPS